MEIELARQLKRDKSWHLVEFAYDLVEQTKALQLPTKVPLGPKILEIGYGAEHDAHVRMVLVIELLKGDVLSRYILGYQTA